MRGYNFNCCCNNYTNLSMLYYHQNGAKMINHNQIKLLFYFSFEFYLNDCLKIKVGTLYRRRRGV